MPECAPLVRFRRTLAELRFPEMQGEVTAGQMGLMTSITCTLICYWRLAR